MRIKEINKDKGKTDKKKTRLEISNVSQCIKNAPIQET